MLVREVDERRISGFLADLIGGRGPALCIDGDAGSGKTLLLRRAELLADGAGIRVIRATGTPTELDIAFSGLHALVWPVRDVVARLEPCQRQALESAAGIGPVQAAEPLRIAAAMLALMDELSGDGPLAVVIDDLQWIDESTRAIVDFLVSRLGRGDVGVIAAARRSLDEPPVGSAGFARHRISPLSAEEVNPLLDDHAIGSVTPAVAAELARRLQGNPLALIEASRALVPGQRDGEAPLPESLPLGHEVRAAFGRGLEALDADTRLALVAAALMQSTDRATLHRASRSWRSTAGVSRTRRCVPRCGWTVAPSSSPIRFTARRSWPPRTPRHSGVCTRPSPRRRVKTTSSAGHFTCAGRRTVRTVKQPTRLRRPVTWRRVGETRTPAPCTCAGRRSSPPVASNAWRARSVPPGSHSTAVGHPITTSP